MYMTRSYVDGKYSSVHVCSDSRIDDFGRIFRFGDSVLIRSGMEKLSRSSCRIRVIREVVVRFDGGIEDAPYVHVLINEFSLQYYRRLFIRLTASELFARKYRSSFLRSDDGPPFVYSVGDVVCVDSSRKVEMYRYAQVCDRFRLPTCPISNAYLVRYIDADRKPYTDATWVNERCLRSSGLFSRHDDARCSLCL